MQEDLETLIKNIKAGLVFVGDLENTQSTELVNSFLEVATVLSMSAISTGNFEKLSPILVNFA